jgi:hypothetical protein
VAAPVFDHNLCLLQCVEDFAVEQFIAQLAVEALAIAILPWTSRFDVSGLGSDGGDFKGGRSAVRKRFAAAAPIAGGLIWFIRYPPVVTLGATEEFPARENSQPIHILRNQAAPDRLHQDEHRVDSQTPVLPLALVAVVWCSAERADS